MERRSTRNLPTSAKTLSLVRVTILGVVVLTTIFAAGAAVARSLPHARGTEGAAGERPASGREQPRISTRRTFSVEPSRCPDDRERLSGEYDVREDTDLRGRRAEPVAIRTSFATSDASSSLAFAWETDRQTAMSRVRIGLSPDSLRTVVRGRSSTTRGLRNSDRPRRVHHVRVCDLPPSSTIYYQVGGPEAWSPVYHVKTGPEPGSTAPFRFVYGGDARGNPPVWDHISDRIEAVDADFMIFNGDFVGNGRNQALWDIFFAKAGDLYASLPLVPVIGNHENNALEYDLLLPAPEESRNYVLRYGNAAFVVFDDNARGERLEDEVRPTVEQLLAQASDAEWLFLVNHQPIYSSAHHGGDRHLKAQILKLVDRYDIDVVLHGHNHVYERTVPIRDGQRDDARGAVYLVSGGLGSPLHEASSAWFTAYSEAVYHYVIVEIAGESLTLRAINLDGDVIDRASLHARSIRERSLAPAGETTDQ